MKKLLLAVLAITTTSFAAYKEDTKTIKGRIWTYHKKNPLQQTQDLRKTITTRAMLINHGLLRVNVLEEIQKRKACKKITEGYVDESHPQKINPKYQAKKALDAEIEQSKREAAEKAFLKKIQAEASQQKAIKKEMQKIRAKENFPNMIIKQKTALSPRLERILEESRMQQNEEDFLAQFKPQNPCEVYPATQSLKKRISSKSSLETIKE